MKKSRCLSSKLMPNIPECSGSRRATEATRHPPVHSDNGILLGRGSVPAVAQEDLLGDYTLAMLPGRTSLSHSSPGPWFWLVGSGSRPIILHGYMVVLGNEVFFQYISCFCKPLVPKGVLESQGVLLLFWSLTPRKIISSEM